MRTRALPLVTLTAAALVLTACSAAPAGTTEPAASEDSASGDVGTVVALDDFAALTALSLGVAPDLAFDVFDYETSAAIFEDQGVETQPYGAELDLERVIAAEPDLIIGVSLPTTVAQQEALEQIAPTVILDYTADWRTQLEQTAEALDRADAGEDVIARIDEELAALDDELEPLVASVLSYNETAYTVPEQSGPGSLLAGAGLTRPEAQTSEGESTAPFIDVSLENVPDHDGDVIFLMSGGVYDPTPLTSSPLWSGLDAVQNDRVYEVNAEIWFGSSPFAIDWVLGDIRSTLIDGGQPAQAEDAAEKLRDFLAEG